MSASSFTFLSLIAIVFLLSHREFLLTWFGYPRPCGYPIVQGGGNPAPPELLFIKVFGLTSLESLGLRNRLLNTPSLHTQKNDLLPRRSVSKSILLPHLLLKKKQVLHGQPMHLCH